MRIKACLYSLDQLALFDTKARLYVKRELQSGQTWFKTAHQTCINGASSICCVWTLAYLQVVPEEFVIQLGDLELIGLLTMHDPGAALALRIHKHRVASCPGHHDAILDTQIICG